MILIPAYLGETLEPLLSLAKHFVDLYKLNHNPHYFNNKRICMQISWYCNSKSFNKELFKVFNRSF